MLKRLEAIDVRHVEVEEDQLVGRSVLFVPLLNLRDSLLAAGHVVVADLVLDEHAHKCVGAKVVIFHNQDRRLSKATVLV